MLFRSVIYTSNVQQIGPNLYITALCASISGLLPTTGNVLLSIGSAGVGAIASAGDTTYIKSVQFVDSKSYKSGRYNSETQIRTIHYIYRNSNYTKLIKKQTTIRSLRAYIGNEKKD
mgnify:CR=1 FL=1